MVSYGTSLAFVLGLPFGYFVLPTTAYNSIAIHRLRLVLVVTIFICHVETATGHCNIFALRCIILCCYVVCIKCFVVYILTVLLSYRYISFRRLDTIAPQPLGAAM